MDGGLLADRVYPAGLRYFVTSGGVVSRPPEAKDGDTLWLP